jgi:hypothetical protein
MSWLGLAGAGVGIQRLQSPRVPQSRHPFVVHAVPLGLQPGRHPSHPIKGGPRVLFIPSAPDRPVLTTLPLGRRVKTGP